MTKIVGVLDTLYDATAHTILIECKNKKGVNKLTLNLATGCNIFTPHVVYFVVCKGCQEFYYIGIFWN